MLSKREFLGTEYYAWCQQQYDEARHALKTAGPPLDDISRYMITHHKTTVEIFKPILKH